MPRVHLTIFLGPRDLPGDLDARWELTSEGLRRLGFLLAHELGIEDIRFGPVVPSACSIGVEVPAAHVTYVRNRVRALGLGSVTMGEVLVGGIGGVESDMPMEALS